MSHRIPAYLAVLGVLALPALTVGQPPPFDYCTFLGEGNGDFFQQMQIYTDSSGNSFALIACQHDSTGENTVVKLPLAPSLQPGAPPPPTPDGPGWFTTFGTGFMQGTAVDPDGNFYVVGKTGDLNFPTTDGTYVLPCGQPQLRHCGNGRYLVKFAGSAQGPYAEGDIIYATILAQRSAGNGLLGNGIAVRREAGVNCIYLVDGTDKSDSNLVDDPPVHDIGIQDAVVSKFWEQDVYGVSDPYSPPTLDWGVWLGGSDWEGSFSVAVDDYGYVWVGGGTRSTNFPTTPGAFLTTHRTGEEAFLARLNAADGTVDYATLLPAITPDAVAVDALGRAYVTGGTTSIDLATGTGTVLGPDDSYNGDSDGYLFVVDPTQQYPSSTLVYATYLGGGGWDRGISLVIDGSGRAIVGLQAGGGLDTTLGAYQASMSGQYDAFVARIDPTVSGPGPAAMDLGTYFGGNRYEKRTCVRLDGQGRICLGVHSDSKNGFDPTLDSAVPPVDGDFGGNSEMVIAQFATTEPPEPVPGILVGPTSGLQTTEGGGTDTFTVVLQTQPTAEVMIGISTSDPSEGLVSSGAQGPGTAVTLTFGTSDWDQPQIVIVTGQNDTDPDGPVAYTLVVAPALSADLDYDDLNADDVSATNLDDDGPAPPTVSSLDPNSMLTGSSISVVVHGSGFAAGATLTFVNGSGPAPTASNVNVVSPILIQATLTVGNGGPRGPRPWDVHVTNPGGAPPGELVGGFTVIKP